MDDATNRKNHTFEIMTAGMRTILTCSCRPAFQTRLGDQEHLEWTLQTNGVSICVEKWTKRSSVVLNRVGLALGLIIRDGGVSSFWTTMTPTAPAACALATLTNIEQTPRLVTITASRKSEGSNALHSSAFSVGANTNGPEREAVTVVGVV